jgi:hypothetical protein
MVHRRQVVQQIIHNNGSGNILFAAPAFKTETMQVRASEPHSDLRQTNRTLRVQNNLVADENLRLRTRLKSMANEQMGQER